MDDNHTFQRARSVKKERRKDDHIDKAVRNLQYSGENIRVGTGRIGGGRGKGVGSFQIGGLSKNKNNRSANVTYGRVKYPSPRLV